MAHFRADVPKEVMWQFETLLNNCDSMIDDMVKAGAEVVLENVRNRMPETLRKATVRPDTLHLTKVYTTPSDGGRNCGIWFGGYFVNEDGEETPIELVANMFEYGSNQRKYPKHPFLRKSFHKREIERAMLKAQKKYIKEEGNLR